MTKPSVDKVDRNKYMNIRFLENENVKKYDLIVSLLGDSKRQLSLNTDRSLWLGLESVRQMRTWLKWLDLWNFLLKSFRDFLITWQK